MLDVAILCGGRGMRLQEHTQSIPKPLVEIGGRPILWHVLQIYIVQGFRRFHLLTGYLGDQVEEFVAAERWPADVAIECVDTGPDTPTGGRILRARERLDGRTFCATYADGVADIDLGRLLAHHTDHSRLATMTVVRPALQFGVALIDPSGTVTGFREKPRADQWVNGGFFCFEPGVFDYLGESTVLERAPLEGLAAGGELQAYRHTGFWECMDTYKDALELSDAWASGNAPWKLWD